MKERLVYFLKYYLFWLCLFLVQKPLFMLSQWERLGDVRVVDWFFVPWHALPLDLSVASYLMLPVGLMMIVSAWVRIPWMSRIMDGYTAVMLSAAWLLFISDVATFPSWGFHLDRTLFLYLQTPMEVLACAETWQWIAGVVVWIMAVVMSMLVYRRWMGRKMEWSMFPTWQAQIGGCIGWVLLTALLFLPIRGSLTVSTMNTGRVYFSDNRMLNLSAINPIFNMMESLSENTFDTERYTYMPSAEATRLLDSLYLHTDSAAAPIRVLQTTRPNIILFILESFSHNAWEAMPNVRRLSEQGVYFSRVMASSFRTDRGVVAVMSAFPGQPTSSIMTVPHKAQQLPQIGKDLSREGYRLKFWHGGDEDFTCMRSYLISGGFTDRVSDHSFPVADRLSKWGVPDHILFSRLSEELCERSRVSRGYAEDKPTLDVVLTLSSHEPFEVPALRRFDNPYLNAVAYTDSCIGALVDTLRTLPTWDNTLLVLVADHGFPYPATLQNHETRRYHIPIVMAGGAVTRPLRVDHVASQIDLVPTLLGQMEIDHSAYRFGKDMLDPAQPAFAFYSFVDGYALVTETDSVALDARANTLLMGSYGPLEQQARAYVQRVMETIDAIK